MHEIPKRRLGAAVLAAGVLGLLVFVACDTAVTDGLQPPARVPPVTGPADIRPISGDKQSGPVGLLLPDPLVARVYDSTGIPVPGVAINWTVDNGGNLAPEAAVTDSNGNARAIWILGDIAGTQSATVSSAVGDVTFTSTATRVLVRLVLQPQLVTLAAGGTQQYTVSGVFSDSSTGNVSVNYSVVPSTSGSITTGGLLTAGTTPGSFLVIATKGTNGIADTATVNVLSPVATLTSITISPKTPTTTVVGNLSFTASGKMSDNTTIVPNVNWSTSGGSIGLTTGKYTPPATAGTYTVRAFAQGTNLGDSTTVKVNAAPAPDPNEPTYTAGTDIVVAFDNFSDYNSLSDLTSNPGTTRPKVGTRNYPGTYANAFNNTVVDPTHYGFNVVPGPNGEKTIRAISGTGGGQQEADFVFPRPDGAYTEPPARALMAFQFQFRVSPGGAASGNPGVKWFEWWQGANRMQVSLSQYGSTAAHPVVFNVNNNAGEMNHGWNASLDPKKPGSSAAQPVGPWWTDVNNGGWHTWTVLWLGPTGLGTRDGVLRVWLDHTKIIDLEQATVNVTPPGGVKPWCLQNEVDVMAPGQSEKVLWPSVFLDTSLPNWSIDYTNLMWWIEK